MVVVIVKVKLKPTFVFFLIVVMLIVMFLWSSDSLHIKTRSVDGPSLLMEGVRGEHEHHNQQKSDKEENKDWFAILLLQSLQPYAATCG